MKRLRSIRKKLKESLRPPSEREKTSGESRASGSSDEGVSSLSGRDGRYVLGKDPQRGGAVTVPADIGKHSLILGTTGTGKSTFLLSQMIQDVARGHSIILIDPHGGSKGLSHKFLSHIPEDRWDDVVYINPMTAFDRSRVVKINFLQTRKGMRSDLVREMFIDCLRRTYPKFWGPRLENILTHSLMLLYDQVGGSPTMRELTNVVANRDKYRDALLKSCTDDEICGFWDEDFEAMKTESYTSVMNKIYKMMTASPMEEFAEARSSSVNLYKAMNKGKIIILEIPKGKMTENLSAFFGSIFLARLAQLAMRRSDIPEDERSPVHVYIDEAHTFVTEILQRNMQELRKFGVFLTACSQNLQRYTDSDSENILDELADYVVAFRCGEETAKRIGQNFETRLAGRYSEAWEPLTKLKDYQFYAAVPVGTTIEIKKAKTIDAGVGKNAPSEVIEHSLKKHGEMTSEKMRVEGKGDVKIGAPHLAPAQFFVLHYLDDNGWGIEGEIIDHLTEYMGVSGKEVLDAIGSLHSEGYIGKDREPPDCLSEVEIEEALGNEHFIWPLEKGMTAIYPEMRDPRIGGVEHISMMCQVVEHLRIKENEIVSPLTPDNKPTDEFASNITRVDVKSDGDMVYPDLIVYYDHTEDGWMSNRRAAIEVETNVEKMNFKNHFRRNRDRLRMPTLLVVRSEDQKAVAERELGKEDAKVVDKVDGGSKPKEVQVMVVDPEDIEHPSKVEGTPEHEVEVSRERRLYRQVRRCCKVNDAIREYRNFVELEEKPKEKRSEEGPGTEEEKVEEESKKESSGIREIVDRVENSARERNLDRLKANLEKLTDEGCSIEPREGEEVWITYQGEEGKRRFGFGEEVATPVMNVIRSREGGSSEKDEEETEAAEKRAPGSAGSLEEEEGEGRPEDQEIMSEEERRKWNNKTAEEKWEEIERIVKEAKELKKSEESSPQELSKKLRALKERGCSMFTQPSGEYEYLRVDKSVSGSTKHAMLGSLDEDWRKACDLAGLKL